MQHREFLELVESTGEFKALRDIWIRNGNEDPVAVAKQWVNYPIGKIFLKIVIGFIFAIGLIFGNWEGNKIIFWLLTIMTTGYAIIHLLLIFNYFATAQNEFGEAVVMFSEGVNISLSHLAKQKKSTSIEDAIEVFYQKLNDAEHLMNNDTKQHGKKRLTVWSVSFERRRRYIECIEKFNAR